MKVCTKCKIVKEDSEFRLRNKPRNGKDYFYLNPACHKCELEAAKKYYNSKKDDEAYKQKNKERAKAYSDKNIDKIKIRKQTAEFKKKHTELNMKSYVRMRDVIAIKNKIKRQTPEYKAMMKAYRNRNKEKIRQQELITKDRYHQKNKNPITDKYVKNLLRTQGNRNPTEEEIETKRSQVLISRIKGVIKTK